MKTEDEYSNLKKIMECYADNGQSRELDTLLSDFLSTGLHQNALPKDYLESWKRVSRCFGFASHDESWHEFGKEYKIIVIRMLEAEAKIRKINKILEETE